MSEQTPPPAVPTSSSPPLDTRSLTVTYSNFFRGRAGEEEVMLDFGVHAHYQGADGPEPILLTHRLVLNWSTTRALLRMLQHLVQQHEKGPPP